MEAARADLAERTKLTQELIIQKLMANVDAAAADKNFSAVNRGCEILGRHLGMWTLEDDADKRKLDDHVPLEDRLAGYLREETINAAANVERMRP